MDIFSYDIADALQRSGCVLCQVEAADDRRWIESWWREGRNSQEGRQRFYDGGGFCRRHGWLLHEVCVEKGSGAAIAAVYGALAERDVELLEQSSEALARGRRRPASLERGAACSACVAAHDALERRAYFLVQLLRQRGARERYVNSDGLCFAHLASAVDVAVDEDREVALFLVDDWKRRLASVRGQLAEFDRKRDHRAAAEPKGREQDSWTEVLALYVGRDGA